MNIKVTKEEKAVILRSLIELARIIPDKDIKKENYDLWKKISGSEGSEYTDAFVAGGKMTKVKEYSDGAAIWNVEAES